MLWETEGMKRPEFDRHGLAWALGSFGSNGPARQHTVSPAARRRISVAQKARWAKQKSGRPKCTNSAAGRKRIAAAQRARWAKVKRDEEAA